MYPSNKVTVFCCICLFVLSTIEIGAYPIDGYPDTGIRRIERARLVVQGSLQGPKPPIGAQKPSAEIRLNLLEGASERMPDLPPVDPILQKEIDALFPNRDESYSLCVLEVTKGKPLRYAERQPNRQFSPGSVGKLAICAGLFSELKRLYPESVENRRELLKSRFITAGHWIHSDHHDIPFFNPVSKNFVSRPAMETDTFSLYEWVDHMLSASANSAASVVWKETILMRHFGSNYPPTREQELSFFKTTERNTLRDISMSVVNDPLRTVGISKDQWQLGTFFTQSGKKTVPSGGNSYGTSKAMLRFLVAMESGYLVDKWSSLEIKKLMYLTAKRIRYASSPALDKAAVYYKSGSLYKCSPEPDFKCGKYKGNVDNYMNSVTIIEHPDGRTYMVTLMSNVLRKNSAVEHQSIATFIDRILTKAGGSTMSE